MKRKDVGCKILTLPQDTGSVSYYVRNVKKKSHEPIQVVEVRDTFRLATMSGLIRRKRTTRVIPQRFVDFFEATQYLLHYIPVPEAYAGSR